MSDTPHREVRHDPDTGHIAINLGQIINGAGQRWLLVHLDERGDVVATALNVDDVQDWPELRRYTVDEDDEE